MPYETGTIGPHQGRVALVVSCHSAKLTRPKQSMCVGASVSISRVGDASPPNPDWSELELQYKSGIFFVLTMHATRETNIWSCSSPICPRQCDAELSLRRTFIRLISLLLNLPQFARPCGEIRQEPAGLCRRAAGKQGVPHYLGSDLVLARSLNSWSLTRQLRDMSDMAAVSRALPPGGLPFISAIPYQSLSVLLKPTGCVHGEGS